MGFATTTQAFEKTYRASVQARRFSTAMFERPNLLNWSKKGSDNANDSKKEEKEKKGGGDDKETGFPGYVLEED